MRSRWSCAPTRRPGRDTGLSRRLAAVGIQSAHEGGPHEVPLELVAQPGQAPAALQAPADVHRDVGDLVVRERDSRRSCSPLAMNTATSKIIG